MVEVTLSANNQVVIPREARAALGLQPGDKLLVVVRGERLIVTRKPPSPHTAMRGIVPTPYGDDYLEKERDSWR